MTREKANELLERYLYKIGEELPAKQRDDVKAELRSLLTDALEERAAEAGRPVDEELAVAVVREFGQPGQVAARYQPAGQQLIGPQLYPGFVLTTKIVLVVLAGIHLLGLGLTAILSPGRLPAMLEADNLIDLVTSYIGNAFMNVGVLVLVFALIERFSGTEEESEKEWDPRELPAVPVSADPERISPPGLVFKIYAIIALFAWVNFFPETFGIWFFAGNEVRTLHFSDLGLHLPILLMNIWWGAALALNVWLLRLGRWTRESRWAEFGLGVYGGVVLYLVLIGSAFVTGEGAVLTADTWREGPMDLVRAARENLPLLGRLLHYVLTFILLATVVEALVRLYRVLRRYPVW